MKLIIYILTVIFCSIYFVFTYKSKVNVYVIDSLIDINHREFGGRAIVAYSSSNCSTPVEHGTHIAGIIGGYSIGVTKNVILHSVNIVDCNYKSEISDLINSIKWIINNHQKPAVINMALIPDALEIIPELDQIIEEAINSGIIFISSAGNNGIDRCNTSPSRVKDIILVGSINKVGMRSYFSNYGNCITVYAEGENIVSSIPNMKYLSLSGTSQSTPYITGIVAEYLLNYPSASQHQIINYIHSISIDKKIFK